MEDLVVLLRRRLEEGDQLGFGQGHERDKQVGVEAGLEGQLVAAVEKLVLRPFFFQQLHHARVVLLVQLEQLLQLLVGLLGLHQLLVAQLVFALEPQQDQYFRKLFEVGVEGRLDEGSIVCELGVEPLHVLPDESVIGAISTSLFEPGRAQLKILDVAVVEFEQPADEHQLHFAVLQREAVFVQLQLEDLAVRAEVCLDLRHYVVHALLEVLQGEVPLLDVGVGLAQVLQKVARVVLERVDKLQGLNVLQYLFREMSGKVALSAVPMQLVDDLGLLVHLLDVLSSPVTTDLDIDVPAQHHLSHVLQFEQVLVHALQQTFKHCADDHRLDEYQGHCQNYDCVQF